MLGGKRKNCRRFWLLFLCCSALWVSGSANAASVAGRVTANELNVRIFPDARYSKVAQLVKDNPVAITGICGDWYQIELPANGVIYVAGNYIKEGKLTASVRLRSGPGTGYEAYGSRDAGTSVEVIAGSQVGSWVRIKVNGAWNLRAYVSKQFVSADAKALATLPKTVFDLSSVPPVNPDFVALEPNFVQPGRAVTRTGYVYKLERKIFAITHVLYLEKDGEYVPVAYLVSLKAKLQDFNEKTVRLSGTAFQVKAADGKLWDLPVIVINTIVEK